MGEGRRVAPCGRADAEADEVAEMLTSGPRKWPDVAHHSRARPTRAALLHELGEVSAEVARARESLAHAEEELERTRATASLLSTVLDRSPVSTWIARADGTPIRSNPACSRLFGIAAGADVAAYDLLGDAVLKARGLDEEVRAVLEEGRTARFTVECDRRELEDLEIPGDGHTVLDVTVFPVMDAAGAVAHVVAQHEDITARVRAEEERDRLFVLSPDLVCIAGFDGYFKRLNPSWERVLGYTAEELMAVPFVEFVHPDDRERMATEMRRLARGVGAVGFEDRYRCRDGSYRCFQWSASSNLPRGLVYAVARDVTERRQAEDQIRALNAELERRVAERTEALAKANRQLEAANRELEAFSYSVSHDLRAPLRHIAGFAQLLRSEVAATGGGEAQRHVNIILEAVRRMGSLIDDLLVFARVSREDLRYGRISLGVLVDEARQELQAETLGRNVMWRVAPLPEVRGDTAMLRRVLVNLLGNALKYSRGRAHATIEIGCERRPGEIVFFVRDNGVGFDMRHADKLFGVFQRLHRDEEFEGTGIGLASVQRILHRHGGRVWAEGAVGEGATIYCALPAREEEGAGDDRVE